MVAVVELDGADKAALVALLKQAIAADPFPMSLRALTLRAILTKLQPPSPRSEPLPGTETIGTTERGSGEEEAATALA
jgi:hypothetical protein